YNPNLGLFAYELLFRSNADNNHSEITISGDEATSKVFVNTFFEMGIDNVVGSQLACINLSDNVQAWNDIPVIEPERIILDIPQSIEINETSINAIKALKESGYTLALDDIAGNNKIKKLLKYVSIIRIDVRKLLLSDVADRVKKYKGYPVKLLADKVENLADFDALNAMNFHYFQGYFLSRPKIVMAKKLPNNKLSIMNMIATLNNPATEVDEIELVLERDASLSYKILKLINSAGFGLRVQVHSMHHAIVMLGKHQLASWASMLALGSLDDRPQEMLHLCMIRAKTCELLAQAAKIKNFNCYFIVGLLSALDLIMERKLSTILKQLPLAEDVKSALLEHQGLMGEAL
ncbi:Predicted signal transduction protein, partial [hydrothermal vent metagenome]